MPWRGPVRGSADLRDQFPSLGWEIADILDDLFWWMPCTDEQVRKLVHCYRIDPKSGQRVYRRAQFMGPKGVGKSPEAAKFGIAELALPVVFDGWDADGEPVGRPRVTPTPWVQIAAVSLDQTDNTYGAMLQLLTENDGEAADALGLDPGDTRTVLRSNHRARIDKVTASAGAREGQPITAAVLDETHLWLPTNGGKNLARTIRRNVAKMNGFSLETTNAYDPNVGSVAQGTDEAVVTDPDGLYQWKPTAPHLPSLHNRQELRRTLRKLYKDCHWIDVDRLIAEMADPDTTEADNRRFYLNEVWAGQDAAWTAELWNPLARPDEVVADGERITIGFDGSRYNDATAIVGVRLEDRHEFLIAAWEDPGDDDEWEVDATAVEEAMEMAFDRWRVASAYCDPPYWEDTIDRWAGRYGPVRKWYTAERRKMADAVRSYDSLLRSESLTHDGSDVLTRHTLNAQRRDLTLRDDEGRFLWTIGKKSPKSPLKIDARVAGILAQQAAGDAIAKGALKRRRAPSAFI